MVHRIDTLFIATCILYIPFLYGFLKSNTFYAHNSINKKGIHLSQQAIEDFSKTAPVLQAAVSSSRGVFRKEDLSSLLHLTLSDADNTAEPLCSLQIVQKTSGHVPRSYLPSIMILQDNCSAETLGLMSLLEEGFRWFLDSGGRLSKIEIACPPHFELLLKSAGFDVLNNDSEIEKEKLNLRSTYIPSNYLLMRPSSAKFKASCEKRLLQNEGEASTLYDIIGRLLHDMGDPGAAIQPYTKSLQANPKSAATFRNLGSAYHSVGDTQLAFASYQQAIQLDPKDGLVYLKLAFFYEDFANKDWIDAELHSQRCYQYYLDTVDPEDVAILTRLGNLLVREHLAEQAVGVYDRILKLDDSIYSVWFNKAHAQVKIGDYEGAKQSLQRTLDLEPTISAAKHMLRALDEEEALRAQSAEEAYVKDLFNSYADNYDSHGKKLLYSAPRIIRQELASIYKVAFADRLNPPEPLDETSGVVNAPLDSRSSTNSFLPAEQPVGSSCSTYSSFMNHSLDILDIGCGTGLVGAWLKDYARTLVGVDISEQMVNAARKKQLYQELHVMPLLQYFNELNKDISFDLVVAADVLAYVGELQPTFEQVVKVLRPSALFVFTVEAAELGTQNLTRDQTLTLSSDHHEAGYKGFRLLPSGRFGYSKDYVDGVITRAMGKSCRTLMSRAYSPRLEAGQPIPGYLYIVEKLPLV